VELRFNLLFLGLVALAAMAMTASEPVAALDPHALGTRHLRALEDRFAREPGDHDLALRLAEAYLERDRPELAITALRAADARVLDAPDVVHRLSQAYEAMGRLDEAESAAERAYALCERAVDWADGELTVPPPLHPCTAQVLAVLDVHRVAVHHLLGFGVHDPRHDGRTRLAYDLAMRRARVALAE